MNGLNNLWIMNRERSRGHGGCVVTELRVLCFLDNVVCCDQLMLRVETGAGELHQEILTRLFE